MRVVLRACHFFSFIAACAWLPVASAQAPANPTGTKLDAAIDQYNNAKDDQEARRAFQAIRDESKTSARAGLACALFAMPAASPVHDAAAARECLESSAAAGSPDAQHQLALVLLESPRSDVKSRERAEALLVSASRTNPDAVFLLALLRADKSADPAHARDEVIAKAAGAGFAPAQYRLATSLLAKGDEASAAKARELLEEAAKQQYTEAQVELALVLEKAKRDADVPRIVKLLESASDSGSPRADYALGMRYIKAIGVKRDSERALRLVRRSAMAGYEPAQYALAFLIGQGIGTGTDDAAALYWLRRSAEQGNANAMHGIGNAYANGWGVGKSLEQAYMWYCRAAQKGNLASIDLVKRRPPGECPLPQEAAPK
jgi:TPR repeat protein